MECELCGSNEKLQKVKIEGAVLSVCPKCSKLGDKIIENKKTQKRKIRTRKPIQEPQINPNYPDIIRKAREQKNLSRKQLSKKLNIKQSLIKNLEKGKHYPQINIAKKLEQELNINLTDFQIEEQEYKTSKPKPLTLGDVAQIKKKSSN